MSDNGVMMREVVLLGSTGSIGTQALDIVARNPDRFRVTALAAGGSNLVLLADQVLDTEAPTVGIANSEVAHDFTQVLIDRAAHRGQVPGQYQLPEVITGPIAFARPYCQTTVFSANPLALATRINS